MAKPIRYRLGVYNPDPDRPEVEFSNYTFASTPAGIQAMRAVIAEYYDRGNDYCVGIFPASGHKAEAAVRHE